MGQIKLRLHHITVLLNYFNKNMYMFTLENYMRRGFTEEEHRNIMSALEKIMHSEPDSMVEIVADKDKICDACGREYNANGWDCRLADSAVSLNVDWRVNFAVRHLGMSPGSEYKLADLLEKFSKG